MQSLTAGLTASLPAAAATGLPHLRLQQRRFTYLLDAETSQPTSAQWVSASRRATYLDVSALANLSMSFEPLPNALWPVIDCSVAPYLVPAA